MPLPAYQRAGSFFRNWRFEVRNMTDRRFTLAATDSNGVPRWQLDLTAEKLNDELPIDLPVSLRIDGPLIQLVMRRRIAMLDGFDAVSPPRVLWTRDLYDPNWSPALQRRSEIGIMGLLTDQYVFYQVGSTLVCADATTGQEIWERRNAPSNSMLHGDSEYLIAARNEPIEPNGLVLRSRTGEDVLSGYFAVPGQLFREWRGRHVLAQMDQPSQLSLAMIDIALRKTDWTQTYHLPTIAPVPIDEEEFGVLDADGRLVVRSYQTGATVVTAQIERMAHPPQIHRVGNRYLVMGVTGPVRFPLPTLRNSPGPLDFCCQGPSHRS